VDERARLVEQLFVNRHAEAVRLAWGLTGDAALAQELAQEAFVRVFVHRRRLRDPAAAPAYLRRTVVNLVFSHSRSAMRVRRSRQRAGQAERGSSGIEETEDRVDVTAALATLPIRRRACVVLRYYVDLTEAETAEALGISIGTVKSQTHKALAQLRQQLAPLDITLEREDRT
jgi:RNA polymerase sigma-70 factor (sigma-E family)